MKSDISISFFKLGGTWDMVRQQGKLIGSGGLDDIQLAMLEKEVSSEEELLHKAKKHIERAMAQSKKIGEQLAWVADIQKYADASFYSLYSGDSSHLRASLAAPIIACLLSFANAHPTVQVICSQGTDTADLTILPFLDALLFDTELLPMLFTGANRSQVEWNSDALKNFADTFRLVGSHIPAGGYWVFASHLYRASDMVKIDPAETRRVENYTTFFAPRLTSRHTKKVIEENSLFPATLGESVAANHPIALLTSQKLFDARQSIDIVDLGNQNSIASDIEIILNPKKKGVIIAAHAFGNGSNPIRKAAAEAAKKGKLVVIIDKSLLGSLMERYAASLLGINAKELVGTPYMVISGNKMNKAIAKAVLTRAIIEGYNQHQTQELILYYCEARGLLE
jgi:L-asparaginase/Glu-tRNA(Gln) amidotransferase subunit D